MTRTASDIISNPPEGDRIARIGPYGAIHATVVVTGTSGRWVHYESDTGSGSMSRECWRSMDAEAMRAM